MAFYRHPSWTPVNPWPLPLLSHSLALLPVRQPMAWLAISFAFARGRTIGLTGA